jgi:hypothetical protein
MGADFVVHSLTKYLSGHGDLVSGAIIGPGEDIQHIHYFGVKHMTGAVISAFDSYLIIRGLKTLEIRMDRHCQSAQKLAEAIERHPGVEQVYYPGLNSHPQHELAKKQMHNFGGMIAFELKGGNACCQPGRGRNTSATSSQYDPRYLLTGGADGTRYQRGPGTHIRRSGKPGGPDGGYPAGSGQECVKQSLNNSCRNTRNAFSRDTACILAASVKQVLRQPPELYAIIRGQLD